MEGFNPANNGTQTMHVGAFKDQTHPEPSADEQIKKRILKGKQKPLNSEILDNKEVQEIIQKLQRRIQNDKKNSSG